MANRALLPWITNKSPENSKFDEIVQHPINYTTVLNSQSQV